jgi:uncharacterized protein YjbI with pentapeptide repeats
VAASEVVPEESFVHVQLIGVELSGLSASGLSFDESILEKVLFGEARLERLGLTDSELLRCDLAAARCTGSSFIRVGVSGTRLAGTDLSRSLIKDVVFEDCKLDMANFRFTKLTRVRFISCTLHETDFQMAELTDVEFQSCQLLKTAFDRCKPRSVDARTSQLHDIRGWQSLRGLTIDPIQLAAVAPELAAELGLKVAE